ncbi:hypothetical protein CHS0354_014077 [Potamilus streckersoni]|uniref:Uncharacterized protein n=1 Tax=Potamilus streckersoni TaxID=2493646 RepID=A0AAE0T1V8_9BIVA|nr:hypothetical protein CHS0354_014077 [Potamilus streckersoni]
MKVQVLSLSAKDYALIAGSVAVAIVLIVIVVSLIKRLRKANMAGKDETDLKNSRRVKGKCNIFPVSRCKTMSLTEPNDADVSVSLSEMNAPMTDKYTFDNNAYMPAYGIPKLTKDHRVYRDPQTGEEVDSFYIYRACFRLT